MPGAVSQFLIVSLGQFQHNRLAVGHRVEDLGSDLKLRRGRNQISLKERCFVSPSYVKNIY
jgi:hypothetical protein